MGIFRFGRIGLYRATDLIGGFQDWLTFTAREAL